MKKVFLKIFAKFTAKQVYRSLLFNKVASFRPLFHIVKMIVRFRVDFLLKVINKVVKVFLMSLLSF